MSRVSRGVMLCHGVIIQRDFHTDRVVAISINDHIYAVTPFVIKALVSVSRELLHSGDKTAARLIELCPISNSIGRYPAIPSAGSHQFAKYAV